ncbi:MAG: 3-deoxy-manno-octulosonate cytidylyltransferase [Candidatus Aminicenantales bacterium]
MRKALGVIPARYHSTRFPGKPLALILGKTMIQRVYERARGSRLLEKVVIAADDERIFSAAKKFGAEVQMTSSYHNSGTERVAEVAAKLDFPIVVNIQGDEPLIEGRMIDGLVEALQDASIPMATLMARQEDLKLLQDRHVVKVVVSRDGFALYFSRAPLPYQAPDFFFQHIGVYGYQKDFLLQFKEMSPSRLEKIEKLEQLRVLENGCKIKMVEIPLPTLSVNTPQDIIKVEEILKERSG